MENRVYIDAWLKFSLNFVAVIISSVNSYGALYESGLFRETEPIAYTETRKIYYEIGSQDFGDWEVPPSAFHLQVGDPQIQWYDSVQIQIPENRGKDSGISLGFKGL